MSMEMVSSFALRLKQYMADHNDMTYEQLSAKTGFPPQTLNRYVLGQRIPKIDMIPGLSLSLHVDPLWLQGYDVPMQSEIPPADIDERERQLVDLFHKVPEESKKLVLGMIKSALNEAGLLK